MTNYVTLTNSGTADLIISNLAAYPSAAGNSGDGFTIAPFLIDNSSSWRHCKSGCLAVRN